MAHKHIIFAFVGASGSGKSTLMLELLKIFPHLQIIKSTTTRPKRDDTDDLFYKFVETDYAENGPKDNFLTHELYAGNHYIYEKNVLDDVLESHCGMFAIVEPTVPKLRNLGYNLKLIKIVPERNFEIDREKDRKTADESRNKNSDLAFDLVVVNSFGQNGLQQSVEKLKQFIAGEIAADTNR